MIDENYLPAIEKLMVDWVLYENGWHALYNDGYKNEHLFYYLTQMHGYSGYKPKELEYFKAGGILQYVLNSIVQNER